MKEDALVNFFKAMFDSTDNWSPVTGLSLIACAMLAAMLLIWWAYRSGRL